MGVYTLNGCVTSREAWFYINFTRGAARAVLASALARMGYAIRTWRSDSDPDCVPVVCGGRDNGARLLMANSPAGFAMRGKKFGARLLYLLVKICIVTRRPFMGRHCIDSASKLRRSPGISSL